MQNPEIALEVLRQDPLPTAVVLLAHVESAAQDIHKPQEAKVAVRVVVVLVVDCARASAPESGWWLCTRVGRGAGKHDEAGVRWGW